MKFIRLVIENYKAFQYSTVIPFPDCEGENNIFLIGGMNGAGKTSIMEAINYCLFGAKSEVIYQNVNRKEKALGNTNVCFELTFELDNESEFVIKRTWTTGHTRNPSSKDLTEYLVVEKNGKRLSVQNNKMWEDFIRATIPPGITQFFFFDGEKIQEIAADDHSEIRLQSSLEAALGIQYITQLASDILYLKQRERKSFVEISDEDLEFKESELKREKSKVKRKNKERDSVIIDLENFQKKYDEISKRFQAAFHSYPESRDVLRQNEKKRIQASNRLGQVENEIKTISKEFLPFSIIGNMFGDIKNQIESERESAQIEAIRENAAEIARKIVSVVEDPEPIFEKELTVEKMLELEQRIIKLLKEMTSISDTKKILDLSDRDSARILNRIEELENSKVFLLQSLIEEKQELESFIRDLESDSFNAITSETDRELFEKLQTEMESYSTQIGRKKEKLHSTEEEIIEHEERVREIEIEIEQLYERYDISREKMDLIEECDGIANLINKYIVRLRKNKILLLQEKTFEMYRLLSSRTGLIKNIQINDETYEITISDRNGHKIRKPSLSAGEKEVFAISLLWGLAQTSQLKLPIIIDTPLSRLDSTHRDNIVNNYFPNAGEQVIILSTDTEIDKEYFRSLKCHLCGSACLEFNESQETTTFKPGYFWEN